MYFQQIGSSRSNGHDSPTTSKPVETSMWQRLWKSSSVENPGTGTGRDTTRRSSSKSDSSQGIARGPWLQKPYSSSAFTRSILKIGWFRCVARTMNLLLLGPTHTATCPAGTSTATFLRHRRSICRTRTMRRILLLLLLPVDADDIIKRLNSIEWVRFFFIFSKCETVEEEKGRVGVYIVRGNGKCHWSLR